MPGWIPVLDPSTVQMLFCGDLGLLGLLMFSHVSSACNVQGPADIGLTAWVRGLPAINETVPLLIRIRDIELYLARKTSALSSRQPKEHAGSIMQQDAVNSFIRLVLDSRRLPGCSGRLDDDLGSSSCQDST